MKKKLLYGLTGLVVALSLVGFVACSDDDDDDGGSKKNKSTDYTAEYGVEDETDSVFSTVTVTVQSDTIIAVTVEDSDGKEYEAGTTADDAVWTVTVGDTTYAITIEGSAALGYTYTYVPGTTYTANWGDSTSTSALASVTVVAANDTVTAVYVDGDAAIEDMDSEGNTVWTYSEESSGTTYTITLSYDSDDDSYSYTYTWQKSGSTTASVASGYTALEYTFTVSYTIYSDGSTEVTKVVIPASGSEEEDEELQASDGDVYTLYNAGDGGYEAVYLITFAVSDAGAVSYTYESTEVESVDATGDLDFDVHVKYTTEYLSGKTTYTVRAVCVGSESTLSQDTDGNYVYKTESEDETNTYTITLDESNAPSYSYTYVQTTTKDYTPTYSGEGDSNLRYMTISVNATVTYSSSTKSYTLDSVSSLTIGDETSEAGEDSAGNIICSYISGTTVYTITLAFSGGSFTYSYTKTTSSSCTAEYSGDDSELDVGVTVYYSTSEGTIQAVRVNDTAAGVNSDGTYTYTVTDEESSTTTVYTITPTLSVGDEETTASYTYTYAQTTTKDYTASKGNTTLSDTISVTVNATVTYDSSDGSYTLGSINCVTAGGDEELQADDDGNYNYTTVTEEGYDDNYNEYSTTRTYVITLDFESGIFTYNYTCTDAITKSYTDDDVTVESGSNRLDLVVNATVIYDPAENVYTEVESINYVLIYGGIEMDLNDDGTYTYSEGDMTYTITAITPVISDDGSTVSFTYEYYYTDDLTLNYTASYSGDGTSALEDITIKVNATVTFDSSDDSYTFVSMNYVTIDGSTYDVADTYTYVVTEDSTSSTVYTITIDQGAASDGNAVFTYSYTTQTMSTYIAEGALNDTVAVSVEDGDVSTVYVGGTAATYDSSADTWTAVISNVEYVISLSGNTTDGFSYSYTTIASGSLSGYTVTATVDSTGKITASVASSDGTDIGGNYDGDANTYTMTVSDVEYTLTIWLDNGAAEYSYTADFTASGDLDETVTVTVTDGTITAVTVGSTACEGSGRYWSYSGESSFYVEDETLWVTQTQTTLRILGSATSSSGYRYTLTESEYGSGYSLSLGESTALDNNDTSWSWWDGATDYVSVSGNFALYLTWDQSSDDYADNTLEMYNSSSQYWDWTIVTDGVGWGDLMGTSDTVTVSGTDGTSYLATWEVYVIRLESTLMVYVASDTGYEYYITQTDFTTEELSVGINGNPAAGIDDGTLYYQLGTLGE